MAALHMDDNPPQGIGSPRRRILTSDSRQRLEAKVIALTLQGWEREGDVAIAKSVIDSEPPYVSQAMIQARKALTTGRED